MTATVYLTRAQRARYRVNPGDRVRVWRMPTWRPIVATVRKPARDRVRDQNDRGVAAITDATGLSVDVALAGARVTLRPDATPFLRRCVRHRGALVDADAVLRARRYRLEDLL